MSFFLREQGSDLFFLRAEIDSLFTSLPSFSLFLSTTPFDMNNVCVQGDKEKIQSLVGSPVVVVVFHKILYIYHRFFT